jgi:hypothetical protein
MELIDDAIAEQMQDWVQHFIQERKAALQKGKKGVATGDLLNSFELQIEKMAREEGIALLIAFNESGRYLDMKSKNIHWDQWGRDAINRLEKWVANRGLGGFMPGYLKRHPNTGIGKGLNIQRIISNIAWGIATNRKNGKWQRKGVWNAPKTAATYELINKVAAALPKPTTDTIIQQFK